MHRNWFLAHCNEISAFHSFHIGSTTHLLLLGVNPFIVMVQGRWTTNSFLDYWQNCREIAKKSLGKYDNITPWNTLGKSHKYIKYVINIKNKNKNKIH